MTISWLTIHSTFLSATGGGLDAIDMAEPPVPIDTLYVAVAGFVFIGGFILRELLRRRGQRHALHGGPPRDRPDYSPASLRYLRRFELDAHGITAVLVRLAAKGRIALRMVGDGIDLTRVKSPDAAELSPDEQVVLDTLLEDRDYVDLEDVFGPACSNTLVKLEHHYQVKFDQYFKESNKDYTRKVLVAFALFLVGLALTTTNPVESIFGPLVLLAGVGVVALVIRTARNENKGMTRFRPSLWDAIRNPSWDKLRHLKGFVGDLGMGIQKIVALTFFTLIFGFITLGLLAALFGFESMVLLVLVFLGSAITIIKLPDRLTPEGAECVAMVEHYAESFSANKADDGTGGWADALALGYLSDVDDAEELKENEKLAGLCKEVPLWFTKSGGDPSVTDFLVVLGHRIPRNIHTALATSYRR